MKLESINRNYLFRKAYRSRLNFVSPVIVTYVVKRHAGGVRLGITTGKKIGNAVQRNRARRAVRAAATELLKGSTEPVDVVVVCRHPACEASSVEIMEILREHLSAAGVSTC